MPFGFDRTAHPARWGSCCSVCSYAPSVAEFAAPVMDVSPRVSGRALARGRRLRRRRPPSFAPKGFCNRRVRQRAERRAGLSTPCSAGRAFDDLVVQPRTQTLLSANASVACGRRAMGAALGPRDQIDIARLGHGRPEGNRVRHGSGLPRIIAAQRQIEVNLLARETAQAHLEYAQKRLAGGAGTRLNELRAAQEVAGDEARLEITRLAARRAQEALGVLLAADGPVDAAAGRCSRCRRSLTSPPGWPPGPTSSSSPPASGQRNGPRVTASKTTSPQSLRRSILRPSRLAVSFNPREPGA